MDSRNVYVTPIPAGAIQLTYRDFQKYIGKITIEFTKLDKYHELDDTELEIVE